MPKYTPTNIKHEPIIILVKFSTKETEQSQQYLWRKSDIYGFRYYNFKTKKAKNRAQKEHHEDFAIHSEIFKDVYDKIGQHLLKM